MCYRPLYLFKWLTLCCMNFNSIFKNENAISNYFSAAVIILNTEILWQCSIINKVTIQFVFQMEKNVRVERECCF